LIPDTTLGLTDGEPALCDRARQLDLPLHVIDAEDRAGVSRRDPSCGEKLAHFVRESQEPERIRDRRSIPAYVTTDIFLRERKLFDQLLVPAGFLKGGEVLSLQVLDEGQHEHLLISELARHDWGRRPAEALQGPPSALAGHDLEVISHRSNYQGLEQTVPTDRFRKLIQRIVRDPRSRLKRIRAHLADGYFPIRRSRGQTVLEGLFPQ
jgi:hypothetical protein